MGKLNLTRKELAGRLKRTPEHIRKLLTGEAFPGRDLQERLAAVLEVDPDRLSRVVERDRWIRKYGRVPPAKVYDSAIPRLEKIWNSLTLDQREELACIASCMARRTRARAPH